jgi:O-antigen/teichoic acid export membrane protein
MRLGIFLTGVNLISGAMGYIFQILMGRMLTTQEYSLFSAIMALQVVITSPISAVFAVVSRNVTKSLVGNSGIYLKSSYTKLLKILFLIALLTLLLAFFFNSELSDQIKNSEDHQILLLVLIIASSSLGALNNSFIQGSQSFRSLSFIGLSTVSLKIILSVILVGMGIRVDGALLGGLVATIIANLIGGFFIYLYFSKYEKLGKYDNQSIFEFSKLPPILIAYISMAVMMQLDVLIVNNLFESEKSAIYAVAATLGKAILYLPGGVVLVLFPMVAEAQERRFKVKEYMINATLLAFIMCSFCVIFYWYFSSEIIVILFGEKYINAAELLCYYSIAMLPMALLVIAEYFLMALGKVVFAWLSFIFAPLQMVAIYFFHDSLFDVITIVGISGLLLLICGYIIMFNIIDISKYHE